QHRRRPHIALRIEELRHADFLAQNSCNSRHFLLRSQRGSSIVQRRLLAGEPMLFSFVGTGDSPVQRGRGRTHPHAYLCSLPNALISTSTPAGRSSFIRASTVCCVGSRISSNRL